LENKGDACYMYFAVGAWFSNFCHGKQPFGHLSFENGVSTKTEKSFENQER